MTTQAYTTGPAGRTDVVAIAEDILDACFHDDYRPTRQIVAEDYGIRYDQGYRALKHCKEIAAGRHSALFGFDPEVGYFRYCPADSPIIAGRMLKYIWMHWSDEGSSVPYQLKGAEVQGYITKEELDFGVQKHREAGAIMHQAAGIGDK